MIKELYACYKASAGVSTDTRTLKNGELFFALRGGNFDGSAFVGEALQKGCSYAVTDNAGAKIAENVILVEDALTSLQDLAACHRKKWGGEVFAITGSNGKTTTKELIAAVLSKNHRVLSTTGNLNNHIGVPLTLLRISNEDLAVVEMGANHPGEIALLCEIADPDAGIITNIGKAHLEGFGSIEGVAKAKGELFEYLRRKNGKALINMTDAFLVEYGKATDLSPLTYGFEGPLDVVGKVFARDTLEGEVHAEGIRIKISSKLFGAYNFLNILSAVAAGLYYNVDAADIEDAIRHYEPGNNRSQLLTGSSNEVLLDAYNANPTSMLAALSEFDRRSSGRKMAILGEMMELGDVSAKEHESVLMALLGMNIDEVLLVGDHFYAFAGDERFPFRFFKDLDACKAYLKESPPRNNLIFLKGSRKNMLEQTTNFLLDC